MRLFDIGQGSGDQQVQDRVLTVPNLITALRLAALPVFAYLVIGPEALMTAFVLLLVISATDWIDGYVARRFDQISRIGVVLDPLVDRVLVATAAISMLVAGILPWPIVVALLVRDLLVLGGALVLFGAIPPISVTRTGKTATALLMIGLPAFLLGAALEAPMLDMLALGLTIVGICAYYGAGAQYALAAFELRRRDSV